MAASADALKADSPAPTNRDAAETALRESEARLLLAQESAGFGVWDWDLATGKIYWSPQTFRLLGLDPKRDGGDLYEAWLRILHPDDRDRAHAYAQQRRVDAGPTETEFRVIAPDGTTRWILGKGMPVLRDDGEPHRILGVCIDITDRKLAEAAAHELTEQLEARVAERTRELAEANERLRRERLLSELIVESAAEGVIVIDREMRHLVWNAAMESINGMPRRELLGKTVFEIFPQFENHPIGRAWRDALAGRRAQMRDYHFVSTGRGSDVVYDADFTPLYDPAGAIIGAVALLRETTERYRMEEMLRQSQKLEAVAQLTGGVAHDFNNLLTAVIGCLDMIRRDTTGRRTAPLADTALRSAQRGARLTQQLLAFARRQALHPVAADLNALLGEIEELLRRAAGETVDIVIDPAANLARCVVDPAQFEAAVMNLVINARDAMPGGGRVTLAARDVAAADIPPDADIAPGDYVAFSVGDGGDGMPPDIAARAFEPFFTTKEVGKGSGLGLSMVYGFAKQSGGGVRLDSAPGSGTTVTLYLPRAPAPEDDGDAARPANEPRHGSASILVVEDDEDVREVSVAMLESLGYRVSVAGDGPEALALLRGELAVDLLFTDMVMPHGVSGVALASEARAIRPGLKVLLTTGYAGLETAGADALPIVAKPFRRADLGRIVAGLLDRDD